MQWETREHISANYLHLFKCLRLLYVNLINFCKGDTSNQVILYQGTLKIGGFDGEMIQNRSVTYFERELFAGNHIHHRLEISTSYFSSLYLDTLRIH